MNTLDELLSESNEIPASRAAVQAGLVARIRERETTTGRSGAVVTIDDSRYLIGATGRRNEAIAAVPGELDRDTLRLIFEEVNARGLARPVVVYGQTTRMSETATFKFRQFADLTDGGTR